ncbi:MAG: T9SS type A sorting domain-containing protein [Salibacteraceae bacterium]
MKRFYNYVTIVIALLVGNFSYGQCSISTTGTLQTLTVSGGTGSTQYALVYNPVNSVYYTLDGNYIRTHSGINGSVLSSYYYSTTMRGIWWNPATSNLEGNGYNSNGIITFTVNSTTGYVSGGTVLFSGSHQPYYQCQGVLDEANNEILYFYASSIYRYSRVTGNLIGSTAISNMPASYTLTGYNIIYTGCPGKEIGLYDRLNKKLLFINKATGAYVGASQLPTTAGTPYNWGVSFADDKLWVLNGTSWNSYSTISFGLQTSAISGPFCDNSNVSINFTINSLTFNSGNVFTAQLSDANGSFSSPTTLGSVTSTTAATIAGVIPANTPAGGKYRIRVVSSNPVQTGNDNGTNITINVPTVNLGPDQTICPGDTSVLTAPLGVLSYNWSTGGTNQIENVTTAGTYSVTVSNSVCSKSDTITVSTLPAPTPSLSDTTTVCGSSTVLNPGSFSAYAWSNGATSTTLTVSNSGLFIVTVTGSNTCTTTDSAFVNLLDPTITTGDTNICAGDSLTMQTESGCYFNMTSINNTSYYAVNSYTSVGDDKGGIAVTPNYIYYTGDNYTARYDLNLSSYVRYSQKDGLFSDLSSGSLYTFWSTTYNGFTNSYTYTSSINAIRPLNASLGYVGSPIMLSQSINAGSGSMVFAGSGFVVLWSAADYHLYKIELPSGTVTDLGYENSFYNTRYSSESWASWGIAECNAQGHSFVFRANYNSSWGTDVNEITRFDLDTRTYSTASNFSGLSLGSMACITYSPWNSRWYYQSEYSTYFSNFSEHLGYASAVHNGSGGSSSYNSYAWSNSATTPLITVTPNTTTDYSVTISHGSVSCSDTVTVTVNTAPSFALADSTSFCNVDSGQISTGSTYNSYLWSSGETTQSIYANSGGYYFATVTNSNGCEAYDSTYVNLLDARILQGDTTLCSADSLTLGIESTCGFKIQSIGLNNLQSAQNQNGGQTGGIAISRNYIYSNGPSYCSRFNLTLNSYQNLPVRDGIFSDLSNGQLYTFWNTTNNGFSLSSTHTNNINAIRKMDANLNYGTTIALSQSINASYNSVVAAGTGFVLLWSGYDYNFYKINLNNGQVEIVGNSSIGGYVYFYGGWASYGIAECTDAGISLIVHVGTSLGQGSYRSLGRYDITTGTWVDASPSSNVYSAMTDLTYSRWNNKWYFAHNSARPTLGQYSPSIGYADATATNVGGGNSGSILWSTSDTLANILVKPTTTTSYNVKVSEGSNVCRDTVNVSVIQSPTVTSAKTNLTCYGDTNGTITLTTSGGTTPYSYAWSNSDTTSAVTSLGSGGYAYTVTGNNGCEVVDSIYITSPPEMISTASVNSAASCYGYADGSATVNVVGGIPSYTYAWPSGATDSTDANAQGGWNMVTITDANNCSVIDSVYVTAPAQIDSAGPITSTATFYCPGTTGTLVAANANVGTVSRTLNRSSQNQSPTPYYNSQMDFVFNGLPKNSTSILTITVNYTGELSSSYRYFNVYDENNNYIGRTRYNYAYCTSPGSVTLYVSAANLQNQLSDGSLTLSLVPYGYSSSYCTIVASIDISYDYDENVTTYWFNSQSSDTTQAFASGATANVTPQMTTTYYAANFGDGCSSTFDSITVIVPPAPNTTYLQNPTSVCAGETINVNAYGAVSYSWPTGDPTISGSGSTATVIPTGSKDYLVTITNAFNCSYVDTMSIVVKPAPVGNILTTTNVTCSSANDGQAVVYATGGTSPFTYAWSNGNSGALQLGLSAGTYQVTITDNSTCTDTIDVTVGGPVPVVYNEVVANVSCNGLADGSITLNPTGGTSPFTYLWSNGATSSSISGLSPGNYTITITDNTSCNTDTTFQITEPTALTASISNTTPETCPGVGNGSITSGASGGSTPYTFSWNNGGTTSMLTGLNGGVYSLTVTDANGCTATTSGTVSTTPSTLSSSITSQTNVLCNNGSDGAALAAGSGGSTPYSYSWSDGSTNANLTGVAAGTYSVTVTDNNSCQNVNSVTITEPTALNVSSSTFANATCNGLTDGSASVTVSGGTGGYSFAWPDGATTMANTNLGAGMFYVTITDANSCVDSAQVTITEPTILAMNPTQVNVTCNGLTDGEITTSVSGGTANYTYAWSNASTASSITGIGTGTYSLTITDANNCQVDSTFTITQPVTMVSSISNSMDVMCMNDASGSATAVANGGTSPYTYMWSNSVTTALNDAITAGLYEVTITDANGCIDSSSVTINEPSTLLEVNITRSTDVLCNSLTTGEAVALATGGGTPYTYTWSNGYTDTTNTGLAAGTYSVSVLDNYGCEKTTSVTITEPTAMTLALVASSNVDCFGADNGSATVFANGGTPTYSYLWSNSSATSSISSVGPGIYRLTVTDGNNCVDSTSVTITEPTDLTAAITNSQNVACNGSATGFAVVEGAGGTMPYTYLWQNGNTTDSIYNQTSGFYRVTVTDANGCIDSTLANLTQPSSLTASVSSSTNNLCFGDSIGTGSVSVVGGASPYTYAWSTGSTSNTETNLLAGNHIVTITDANNCQDTAMVSISEPADIITSAYNQINPLCFGNTNGEVTAAVSGGVGSFTYLWSNTDSDTILNNVGAGVYTFTATDGNGCQDSIAVTLVEPADLVSVATGTDVLCNSDTNGQVVTTITGGVLPYNYAWSNGDTTANTVNLAANTYMVTVTDANGCADTLTTVISEPAQLVNTLGVVTDLTCNSGSNGSAMTTTIGGTTPYTFAWTNGQSVESPTNLTSGINVLTVTDANGCIDSTTVTLSSSSNLDLTLVSVSDILCNGDSTANIVVSATGGSGTSTFTWSVAGTDSTLSNMPAGTYTSYVTDNLGCADTLDVVITEPTLIVGALGATMNPLCFGDSTGWAQVTATGGAGNYNYLWPSGDTTDTDSLLSSNVNTVTISDSNNCSSTFDVVLIDPVQLTNIGFNITNVNCYYDATGSVVMNPIGGTLPYTTTWSNGQTGNNAIALTGGVYSVQVVDANGCVLKDTAEVISVNPLTPSMLPNDTVFCGAVLTLTANSAFSQYLWSTGGVTDTANIYSSTTVSFEGLDINGCTTFDTVDVTVFPAAVVNLGADISNICEGTDQVLDAGSFVSYLWSTGETTQTITVATSGTYNVAATDVNGCIGLDDITVTAWALPVVDLGADTILCMQQTSYEIDAGAGFVSYAWSTGGTAQTESVTSTGDYSVVVEDGNGCFGTDTVNVDFDICGGVDEPGKSLSIALYPNPTKGDLNVDLKGYLGQIVEIEVLTTNGQLVKKKIIDSNNQSELNAQIDLNDVAQGLYFVKISTGDETKIERITIY